MRSRHRLLVPFLLLFTASVHPATKTPKRILIRVGADLWQIDMVEKVMDGTMYTGWTECRDRKIQIATWPKTDIQAENAIHEVMHAFTCKDGEVHNDSYNNKCDGSIEHDHDGIYWAAEKWMEFLANPENRSFLEWVQKQKDRADWDRHVEFESHQWRR